MTAGEDGGVVFKQHGMENKESDESTELLDDESLTTEDIDNGVLTREHGSMAHRHDEGVGHSTSIPWVCGGDIKEIASAGLRNHRSS